jgi:hypothetical protein
VAKINPIPEVKVLWLIAPGAAKPTATIEKTKMDSIWLRLLFFSQSNWPAMTLEKKVMKMWEA